ncbi:FBD-associated F-box protein At1g66310-like [Arabidopsis lyrata subsp. lyrata]|uniref:FBD-associated F-box protein At1g66310-like n=1 Tax=Arabidopsis lyrata subsp. lyrata TaxID=81972 RepID=UPI000A29CCFE|nr:FBD-associated F-box protein At1g66310-like [Arabidopsis lyrata subsp. lyrata]|eukprot:XP_020891568.1 FBD-associated F-box protein At1g66310-like [Arabidopsis lyrata subsp. lyrata]
MDEDGEKRVRTKRLCSPESSDKRSGDEVDWVRDLPESLLSHVLLNLPTKDVVKTSVLSSKWRYLWRYVPGLDLDCRDFTKPNTFVSFIDSFMSFHSDSCLRKCKLRFYCNLNGDEVTEKAHMARWINGFVKRKLQYLDLAWGAVEIPPILYMCDSLVSLKLCGVILPKLEFVSLPRVKVMVLDLVKFANDLSLEMLISGCLVLESLTLCRRHNDNVKVLRVRSQSLLSFNYNGSSRKGLHDDPVVSIDAPKLEDLKLSHHLSACFITNKLSSLVEADINIEFNFGLGKKFDPNDLPKREMIRNFLAGISSVKNLFIAPCTLEVIYDYSRCEPLPLFCNLYYLSVDFYNHRWELLPIFLESCPHLKSLVVGSTTSRKKRTSILCGPRLLLSSLEYVEIEFPLKGDAMEMRLVSYLLGNSPILKKLTVYWDDSSRKQAEYELLTIQKRSSSCQIVVF